MGRQIGRGKDALIVGALSMQFKGTLKAPRVDFVAYRRRLQEVLGEAIARAAFEWLGATTDAIPTWSGASLATFSHLASAVGLTLSIAPVARVNRINLGLSNGSGSLTTDAEKGIFKFEYSTTLQYLIFNEFNNANIIRPPELFHKLHRPGPYHFQEKGLAAFDKVAKDVRLPDPTFTVTTYRV
jgi:hypothetical protein